MQQIPVSIYSRGEKSLDEAEEGDTTKNMHFRAAQIRSSVYIWVLSKNSLVLLQSFTNHLLASQALEV